MILKTIKTVAETGMLGIEFVTTDKAITEVIIGSLHIRKGENYSKGLEVLIEAPYEKEERYRLTGTILGFPPAVSYHDTKYEAESAGAKLEDAGAKWSVELVDVMIDGEGKIVSEELLGTLSKPSTVDNIPF